MPYSAKTNEERKSLNGMWHKSKAKLIVLRLACGLSSKGIGEVSRSHLVVPDTPGNALRDCARNLVEDGMMVESWLVFKVGTKVTTDLPAPRKSIPATTSRQLLMSIQATSDSKSHQKVFNTRRPGITTTSKPNARRKKPSQKKTSATTCPTPRS